MAETIPIQQLLLDELNPRHEPLGSQREVIAAMVTQWGNEITKLAEDILKSGISPIDLPLVMAKGKQYVVLEGNRRVVAVKLLHEPSLAQNDVVEARLERL